MSPWLWVRLSVISLAILITGCVSQSPVLLKADASLPTRIDLSDVPFFPQTPLHCGPAALATVLHYQGVEQTPDALAPLLFTPGAKGTYALDMTATVRRWGLVPFPAPEDLSDLLALTAEGWPSVHLMNLGFERLPKWHYAVLVGYDLEQEAVLMRSGTDRMRWYSFYHFEKARTLADHWAIVPAPVDSQPVLPDWQAAYQALLDFEQVQPALTAEAWATATENYAEHWQFPFALGNRRWSEGDYGSAEAAFKSGLERAPHQTVLWNNLGYALHAQSCFDQASRALVCAISLEPDNIEWQASYAELTSAQTGGQCQPLLQCPQNSQ